MTPNRTTTTANSQVLSIAALAALTFLPSAVSAQQTKESAVVRTVTDKFVSGGKPIPIERFEPRVKGMYPAVLFLHGLDDASGVYRFLAKRLAENGYVVLLVHYFKRTGTTSAEAKALVNPMVKILKGKNPDNHRKLQWLFKSWMAAGKDAVRHARTLPHVRQDRVGLVGFSAGAYLSVAIAADQKMKIAASAEFFGGMPPGAAIRSLPPTLIIHGDRDAIVPVAEARRMQQFCIRHKIPHKVRIYKGCGHMFKDAGLKTIRDAELFTHQFLSLHLVRPNITPPAGAR